MKLTNYVRDAFVRAVMNDVPSIDLEDEATELLDKDVIDQLPPLVRRVWDDKNLRHFVEVEHRHCLATSKRACATHLAIGGIMPREAAVAEARALLDKHEAAEAKRIALRNKVKGVAYACSTRKQLSEMLPELVKYLPPEPPKRDRSLPVVADVVSALTKAGWPKDAGK